MKRWVVFDRSTAEAADAVDREVELHDAAIADVLNEAVESRCTVVLVVPAGGEQATVARITPPEPQSR